MFSNRVFLNNNLKRLIAKTLVASSLVGSAYGVSIMVSENDAKVGWNKWKQEWCPHDSVEGGTKTIAYGHKLLPTDDPNKCISDEEALRLFEQDLLKAEEKARSEFNHFRPQNLEWDDLTLGEQQILSALVFNIGTLKNKRGTFGWPKLVKAMFDKEYDTVREEMLTYTNGKPLTRKRDLIWEAVRNNI